jgi:phospholipid/cholesterol/gamma-HCH transport system permease protein
VNDTIRDCWNGASRFAATFGSFQMFSFRMLPHLVPTFRRPRLISEQLYFVGALSLVLIIFGGLFVGMVLALQSYNTLAEFGSTGSIGAFTAEALVRELGPVVAALLFAGRAGASVASEVGLMRATQQISALELMAIDPMRRIAAPRVIAGIISVPLLAAIFSAMGILGASLVATYLLGVDSGEFWGQISERLDLYQDVVSGIFKSVLFGLSASLMAVFEGFHAVPNAAGVSRAATRTVVISSVWILLLDLIVTSLTLSGT